MQIANTEYSRFLFSSIYARVGVAKTQHYLRATLRNNFIKFSSLSCLSLRDLVVHTDRQTYIMMPPSPNTLVVLSAQYNLNNSPITQTRNPPREKHTIYSTISVGLAIVWRYYWFSDHSSARQSCAVLCCGPRWWNPIHLAHLHMYNV